MEYILKGVKDLARKRRVVTGHWSRVDRFMGGDREAVSGEFKNIPGSKYVGNMLDMKGIIEEETAKFAEIVARGGVIPCNLGKVDFVMKGREFKTRWSYMEGDVMVVTEQKFSYE